MGSPFENAVLLEILLEHSDDSNAENLIDQSSTSSSSDSESDEELYMMLMSQNKRGPLQGRSRIRNYVDKTLPGYSHNEFKSHFRMSPETFEFVLGLVGPTVSTTNCMSGRKPIAAKIQLLLTLWVMATSDSYRSICERFNVGKATAIRSVRRVSYALHCVAPRFVVWPMGNRAREVMVEFELRSGFPHILGAIDGTHIKIKAPRQGAQSYLNHKSHHSVHVQAVCTQNLLFTSVLASYTGCVHDARVFRISRVQHYVDNSDTYFPNDSHIVGDTAYGIDPCIMVPFRDNGHLSEVQENFNYRLSSARMAIERAFGLWKGRWRSILHCLPMITIEKVPQYLVATCVLHNICILRGDMIPVEDTLRVARRGRLILNRNIEGDSKRITIMNNLPMRAI